MIRTHISSPAFSNAHGTGSFNIDLFKMKRML